MPRLCLIAGFLLTSLAPLTAQQPVSMRDTHERVIAVVPMIGKGTEEDPRRPMFAPLPEEMAEAEAQAQEAAKSPKGPVLSATKPRGRILAYTCKPSDDGLYALVEFVATDRAILDEILKDAPSEVKAFHVKEHGRAAIRKELGKVKKDFDIDLNTFGAMVP
jgi:hypothetical protein